MTKSPKTLHSLFTSLLMAGAFILMAGCGPGDGQGLDADGNLIGSSDGGTQSDGGGGVGVSGNPDATLAWVQSEVFGDKNLCSLCHQGLSPPKGVNWSSPEDTCNNVGRPSQEIGSMLEIKSGDPNNSYVVWKLEGQGPNGEPIVDGQMPLGMPPLTVDKIQNIRDWISDGTPGCPGTAPRSALDSAGREGPGISIYPQGSWMYVWEQSLQQCATCHSIEPTSPSCSTELQCPPAGLVFSADNYFGLFDGSTVVPRSPTASGLWQRVADNNPGTRMPYGMAPLAQWQQDIIRDWISDGAPQWPVPDG